MIVSAADLTALSRLRTLRELPVTKTTARRGTPIAPESIDATTIRHAHHDDRAYPVRLRH